MKTFKNTRILAFCGLCCLFLAEMLPYLTFSFWGYFQQIKLWNYFEGKAMMFLILLDAVFIFHDYIEKYIPNFKNSKMGKKMLDINPKLAFIFTIGIAFFAIWLSLRLDIDTRYLKRGSGFYCLWGGIFCLTLHSFVYRKERQNHSVSVESQTEYASSPEIVNSNMKFCPNCGNQVQTNAEICFMCGRKF